MVGSVVAILPARGGSRRIPKKNIIDFHGKPLIAWSIEAALATQCFDCVVVSTDDREIADISQASGAEVPFLRDRASDDSSSISEATLAALDQCEAHWKTQFETVVQLMPNCPLRTDADIRAALTRYSDSASDFQISCFRYGWMNPWWAATLDAKGHPHPVFPEALEARSQDLDETYCPTGAIWIANVTALRRAGTFYGPGHIFEPMHWTSAIDIDEPDDLEFANAVWRMKREARVGGREP